METVIFECLVSEYLPLPESHLNAVPMVTDCCSADGEIFFSARLWQFDKLVEMNESAFLEELNKLTKKSLSFHTEGRSMLTQRFRVQIVINSNHDFCLFQQIITYSNLSSGLSTV